MLAPAALAAVPSAVPARAPLNSAAVAEHFADREPGGQSDSQPDRIVNGVPDRRLTASPAVSPKPTNYYDSPGFPSSAVGTNVELYRRGFLEP